MKEFIICAAIKIVDLDNKGTSGSSGSSDPSISGKIFFGHRHNNCYQALNNELSWTMNRQEISKLNRIEGFVTSKNRFVDRREAFLIAKRNKQIINDVFSKDLYSENLY